MTDLAWIDAALVAARPRAVGALLRYFRDLDLAEEAFFAQADLGGAEGGGEVVGNGDGEDGGAAFELGVVFGVGGRLGAGGGGRRVGDLRGEI